MTEVYRPDSGADYEIVVRIRVPSDTPVSKAVTAELEAQIAAMEVLRDGDGEDA